MRNGKGDKRNMTEVQRKYLEWIGYNDYEIQEVEKEIKNGEEPLIFEGNQYFAWESGYNKANEWHYVKDELPKDNEYVLIYTDLSNCYVATKIENHFMSKGWGFIPMSTVIAWKEIILPELKENE